MRKGRKTGDYQTLAWKMNPFSETVVLNNLFFLIQPVYVFELGKEATGRLKNIFMCEFYTTEVKWDGFIEESEVVHAVCCTRHC